MDLFGIVNVGKIIFQKRTIMIVLLDDIICTPICISDKMAGHVFQPWPHQAKLSNVQIRLIYTVMWRIISG